jgi:hypothetical protein
MSPRSHKPITSPRRPKAQRKLDHETAQMFNHPIELLKNKD